MLVLFWSHFIADFLCQSDKMAVNKSTSNYWLGVHGASYTVGLIMSYMMLVILAMVFPFLIPFMVKLPFTYFILNGILHTMVDYGTSRWTSHLWKNEKRHAFFSVVGLDQAIHMTILYLTMFLF